MTPPDDDRRRKVVMSDDDRALIGSRARSVSGEIDTADTIPDVDPADLTPVGTFANRYNDPEVRRLAIDLDKRAAHRLLQSMAERPLGDTDRARIESALSRCHEKLGELYDLTNLLQRQQGEHTTLDNERHRRIDETLADAKAERKSTGAAKWALIVAVAGALGTAAVALYTAAIEKGELGATIRQIVERQADHEKRLDRIEFRSWGHTFSPDEPAATSRTGDIQ